MVYRSPLNTSFDWIESLRPMLIGKQFLLLGDFNFPHIDWKSTTSLSGSSHLEAAFCTVVAEMGLIQHVTEPTRYSAAQQSNCLDLCFTHSEQRIGGMKTFPPIGSSDHAAVSAYLQITPLRFQRKASKVKIWRTDLDAMTKEAYKLDWNLPLDSSIDNCWLMLKNKLTSLCDRFVPRQQHVNRCKPPWFTKELITSINRRRKLWNRYRFSTDPKDYTTYKVQRNLCNKMKHSCRAIYEEKLAESADSAPKIIFSYVKKQLKPVDELPLLEDHGKVVSTDSERAELLLDHFNSVFHVPSSQTALEAVECPENPQWESLTCTTEEVRLLLSRLDSSKTAGPDNIHPLILKHLAPVIAPAVADLFNKSLSDCSVPSEWKRSIVKPIPKASRPTQVENYRPVCLTSVLSKILEKIVKKFILQRLQNNSTLNNEQHGFMKGRSCATNLLIARHQWIEALNTGTCVDVILIDFSKAFDKVDHEELFTRLSTCGINGKLLSWIKSFICNREWCVRVNDYMTDWQPTPSGVPQGTVLGPILFLIHINDLPEVLHSACALFADDLKIWKAVVSENDRRTLQDDLYSLCEWSEKRKLPINPQKTKLLRIGKKLEHTDGSYLLHGETLQLESTVRDLGLLTRNDLKSSAHTEKLYVSSLRMLWSLKRSFSTWTEKIALKLYTVFVRSILESSSPAFYPVTLGEKRKLERVQRLATRLIPSLRGLNYQERCRKLNLFTLDYRRLRIDLIYTFRVLRLGDFPHLRCMFQLAEVTKTRGHPLKLASIRYDNVMHSLCFARRITNQWNRLPESVVSVESVQAFKHHLDIFFAERCFSEDVSTYNAHHQ
jgi:hypothetical protein